VSRTTGGVQRGQVGAIYVEAIYKISRLERSFDILPFHLPAENQDAIVDIIAGQFYWVVNDVAPSYGPLQAEIIVAIRESSKQGGQPIALPIDPASQTV